MLLLLGGLLAGLVITEGTLRILRPDLESAARGLYVERRDLLFARPTYKIIPRRHPDRGTKHLTIYNGLGSRQHRPIAHHKEAAVTRIALLGDSFLNNGLILAEHSLSEPLDYLLNRTGRKFEVLNFGCAGWATDQSLINFQQVGALTQPDVVVYFFYANDVSGNLRNGLYKIDQAGALKRMDPPSFPLASLLRSFYLTYVVMEVFHTGEVDALPEARHDVKGEFGRGLVKSRSEEATPLLRALLDELERVTRQTGAELWLVAIPPHPRTGTRMAGWSESGLQTLLDSGMPTMDLGPVFDRLGWHGLYFENNDHWNEEGNKIAAVHLFKRLAQYFELPGVDDTSIKEDLYRYYHAFRPERGKITVTDTWLTPIDLDPVESQRIRERYLEFELHPERLEAAAQR